MSYIKMPVMWRQVFAVLTILFLPLLQVNGDNGEVRLLTDLLKNYGPAKRNARPVADPSKAINVAYGITLQQIVELDVAKQALTAIVWENFMWEDVRLRWDPDRYDGVRSVRIPPTDVWTPDVYMYNLIPPQLPRTTNLVVSYGGNVLWVPFTKYTSTCAVSAGEGQVTCPLKFGSWTYAADALNLTMSSGNADTSSYIQNSVWDLESAKAERHVVQYACCPEKYIDITFSLKLKARGELTSTPLPIAI